MGNPSYARCNRYSPIRIDFVDIRLAADLRSKLPNSRPFCNSELKFPEGNGRRSVPPTPRVRSLDSVPGPSGRGIMNCQELADRIQRLQPEADTRDVARLCLLLANTTDDVAA